MSTPDESGHASLYVKTLLDRIAEALNCPVSLFLEPPEGASAKIDELLRLWFMIEHENNRTKVLAFMRQTVGTEVAVKEAETAARHSSQKQIDVE